LDLQLIPASTTIYLSKLEGCTRLLLDSGAKSAIFLTPYFLVASMASEFVILPEPFVKKCRSLAKAKDLYVEVMDGQVRLAWAKYHAKDISANKIEYIDRIEASRLGIDYNLLLDAVSEDRATLIDGHYPVTDEIIERLRRVGLRS
jgi:hypothetical protein